MSETLRARVGNMDLVIPVYESPELTQEVVDRVNARLKEIEEASTRVDSQRFALLAAVAFAIEADRTRRERDGDVRELVKVLDALNTELDDLRKTLPF